MTHAVWTNLWLILYESYYISHLVHLHRHVRHFVRDRHHDHAIDFEIDHDHDRHLGVSVICSDLLMETPRDWNFYIERDQMNENHDIYLCIPKIKPREPGFSLAYV